MLVPNFALISEIILISDGNLKIFKYNFIFNLNFTFQDIKISNNLLDFIFT